VRDMSTPSISDFQKLAPGQSAILKFVGSPGELGGSPSQLVS